MLEFATLAVPFIDLKKSSQPRKVQWSGDCKHTFHTLKEWLSREPVLSHLDFSKWFILQTDASEVDLGVVLSQEHEGEEHPVLYLNRQLFPCKMRYSIIEKEALAVNWATEALRYYLLGNPFQCITDHVPLQWIYSMKDTNSRIMRWHISLQPYKFEVLHCPGWAHANADFHH